jgi:hypothetical protein
MGDVNRQVIDRIDELIPALAAYEDRVGRAVELRVYGDGTCTLAGSDAHLCFDEVMARFSNFEQLAEAIL